MNNSYTHLTMIVDRSGSMQFTAREASAAINRLLEEQMSEPGKFTFTITEFDDLIECFTRMNETRDQPKYILRPRGMTALFDAIGSEVRATGLDLMSMPEDVRPAKVIVLIVTDGEENSSREWTGDRVRATISHQREKYGWQFQFLGADESAMQAEDLGTQGTRYGNTDIGTRAVYSTTSANLSAYRNDITKSFDMPDEVS